MEQSNSSKIQRTTASSRARAAAFVGLSVALIAVSAWVTIPIGPVPITLQMFSIPLVICVLPMAWSIAAGCSYIALGAIGVPLFSGFRGGFGVFLGPTGGFLAGYIPAIVLAAFFLHLMRKRNLGRAPMFACEVAAGLIFTIVSYFTGWLQYAAVAGVSLEAAFLVAVAPFIVLDIIKVVAAVACAYPIRKAIGL